MTRKRCRLDGVYRSATAAIPAKPIKPAAATAVGAAPEPVELVLCPPEAGVVVAAPPPEPPVDELSEPPVDELSDPDDYDSN